MLALPTTAGAAPRTIIEHVVDADRPGSVIVDVVHLNDGAGPYVPPRQTAASFMVDGRAVEATLDCGAAPPTPIPAGGFANARCSMTIPTGENAASVRGTISLGSAAIETAQRPPLPSVPAPTDRRPGNAFLGNISAYAPIYAVYGPGTDSEARLQLSFKYQLFGEAGAIGAGQPWENGIHLGFTQRMFWDLGSKSSPFRSIDFMPEIFYLLPVRKVTDDIALGGQIGARHESNGKDGLDSRSLNTVYIQPVASTTLGSYRLTVGPRFWIYSGDLSDNPDIKRYRGNSGLFAEIGKDDGFRLTTASRFNLSTGKGAIDAELSYPLDKVIDSSLNLYLFGQAFAGYGENLLDYDRRMTRFRVGIGIVR